MWAVAKRFTYRKESSGMILTECYRSGESSCMIFTDSYPSGES